MSPQRALASQTPPFSTGRLWAISRAGTEPDLTALCHQAAIAGN
jgi:hypothetical protein